MLVKQRFEVLDSFRGLCALSVVLYHLHVTNSFTEINFFRGSSIFVEFFFVLSGFVLAHGYIFREKLAFKPYLTARFFRLFPLHFFMLSIFIVLELGKWSAMNSLGLQFNNVAFSNDYAFDGLVPNLLLIHAWTPYTNPLSFNTPSWSISIEFYMYLLLFVTIAYMSKFRLILWGLAPIAMFYLMATDSNLIVSPVMRGLSGFFGGVFCYVVYQKMENRIRLSVFITTFIELALIMLVIVIVQSDLPNRSILATSLFFVAVLWFAAEGGLCSALLKHHALQLLGKLSYSIYMTHAAVIYVLTSLLLIMQKLTGNEVVPLIDGVRYFDMGNIIFNNLLVLIELAIVLACSYWTYHAIELRGQQAGKVIMQSTRNSSYTK